ncbi:hypothetical protein EPUS_01844 [Endocarpon pusillum Z07020]|uniref:C2H2-type domain-containing protein n=1 Tax=Endocarpon pusillum (strain Z07020 / HMAS-L-300199) TaxID=1263415 RepID=U1HH70_ENDPU|nr:uncharacterized protein EPUS_01844 [Endocarpon pusillum Z07020]ERF69515.1 hypothetical protein EPUS_01844 [Endocarpon pusillum Z07020]
MAQATSPSLSLQDGGPPHDHRAANRMKSDSDVPIDPSIAQQTSPAYPPPYSPYNAQGPHEMPHYPNQPPPGMYRPNPPDWPPQYGHSHGMPGQYSAGPNVNSASPATAGSRSGQVYSFVPIPGAQQHKRPRRRYEEIERMYKCGWNGCEKAYGTLNHLNAHVTMQSHGIKRTPEEFKEIRKEWKARKKEEETQRKQEEERNRAQAAATQVDGQPDQPQAGQGPTYQPGSRPQLPPIGYQSAQAGEVPSPYPAQQGGMVYQQGNGQIGQYGQYPPPQSPYGQQGQVYQQHNANYQN